MDNEKIALLLERFEDIKTYYEGIEVWLARDLQFMLGYTDWIEFTQVIHRAMESCVTVGEEIRNHFVELNKMLEMTSGNTIIERDFMLTRYACYITVQNGDPKKEVIAFAQSYFALSTRKLELIENRLHINERIRAKEKLAYTEKKLANNIYERGVDHVGFGRIKSKGNQALFGGLSNKEIKKQMGVPKSRELTDYLPTITIKAKDFATEITNFNVDAFNLYGEKEIAQEHVKNNKDVRGLLKKRGITPENLPPEKDIKKIRKEVKNIDNNLLKQDKKLKDI